MKSVLTTLLLMAFGGAAFAQQNPCPAGSIPELTPIVVGTNPTPSPAPGCSAPIPAPEPVVGCTLRVTGASAELSYPSSVETLAVVLVSVRNDGPGLCRPFQFSGPGVIVNASGEPGVSAIPADPAVNLFRVSAVSEFSTTGMCGGAGAQLTAQGMCTWNAIAPGQTVVMRTELRAPVRVSPSMCFDGVVVEDGQRGLLLVGQPIVASFSACSGNQVSRVLSGRRLIERDTR